MLEKKDGILQNNVEEKDKLKSSDVRSEANPSSDPSADLDSVSDRGKETEEHEPLGASSGEIDKESTESGDSSGADGKSQIKSKETGTDDVAESILPKIDSGEEAPTPVGKQDEEQAETVVVGEEKFTEVGKEKKSDKKEKEASTDHAEEGEEDVLEEIDDSNAEDAEDEDNKHRHTIPMLDYHSMTMENLVGELQKLVRNEKVQAIKKHVDGIKYEFDLKFVEFIEQKKEEFVNNGGNEIDFKYNSVDKRQFNEVYADYREKRDQYYKRLDRSLKDNLANRLKIIDELKGLVNVEEDINTTYKNFKDVQERWRNAGPVPRTNYNNVWRTYHHHIEIFYDFLHLNRELRDLDFKHNLEEKLKIIERAEALGKEPDLGMAFHELQNLHKVWKEDIGPVDKEHREAIWERFSNATKVLHQRRQEHYKELDKVYEQNLGLKNQIIEDIRKIASSVSNNHRGLQQQIKEVEKLRDAFFKAGKVPQKVNEQTWAAFKSTVRDFNRAKNNFYKNLKKDQQENLEKKRALLKLAISLKESEDWDTTTPEMKRIQSEWKQIGHVPRKYSDKLWNDFKKACNHYFDRLHALKNDAQKEEYENLEKKNACLESLKNYRLTGEKEKDMTAIKAIITEWKTYGRVPFSKKNINAKFNKILDALFRKLKVSQQEAELLKYGNKIQQLANADNENAIYKERTFIRRKIEESKSEIRQLETNLQFFSNASEDNPLVREVVKNIDRHKESLATWKAKLKKLNILENNLNREAEADNGPEEEPQEEE
ncbi:DUF349 domain-containing protein [Flavobacteriaceae bacterium F89]|uniref:DUF349 domain-containing protein n=1 Tax=Cerina litoralis TaxID=2874477 RepID=A0AAE3JQQ4_9FLAO|nr:DUF349 domain-containing protein [Cerina litoralis]MCG2462119.1 DUF349 domain-containing protein [Cerina litoralis]